MQTWPLYVKAPARQRRTAQSRSAVASTMAPALPPSSRTTFFLPARSFIRQPTAGEPVNVSSLKRSSDTNRSPRWRDIGSTDTAPGGSPASSMISATVEHRERVARGRLEHDRAARRDRRRDLVRGEVQREVEGADARDGPDREAARDADATAARRVEVERDRLADHPLRLLAAEPERERRPVDLRERVLDRLARLARDERADLVAPRGDARADAAQGRAALVGAAARASARTRPPRPPSPPRTAPRPRGTCCPRARPDAPGPRRRAASRTSPSGRRGRSDAGAGAVREAGVGGRLGRRRHAGIVPLDARVAVPASHDPRHGSPVMPSLDGMTVRLPSHQESPCRSPTHPRPRWSSTPRSATPRRSRRPPAR